MNNLIGVSGKIGAGKDLLCDIINYLGQEEDWDSFEHFMEESSTYNDNYKNKKFAGKIKDIICLLIGCTREQIEDREFKEAELGEEWRIWQISYDTERHLFSDKKEAEKMCDEIWDHTDFLETFLLTPRKLLQLIGTEAGRQIIHPNIWVNALFADYSDGSVEDLGEKLKLKHLSNWIITDVRFPNEVKAIEDKGGTVIRIERTPRSYGTEFKIEHSSETALDDYDFDYVINNNGSISDLIDKVRQILIK